MVSETGKTKRSTPLHDGFLERSSRRSRHRRKFDRRDEPSTVISHEQLASAIEPGLALDECAHHEKLQSSAWRSKSRMTTGVHYTANTVDQEAE